MSRCNGAREICAKTGSLPIREITTRLKHYCDFMAIDAVAKSDDGRLPVEIWRFHQQKGWYLRVIRPRISGR